MTKKRTRNKICGIRIAVLSEQAGSCFRAVTRRLLLVVLLLCGTALVTSCSQMLVTEDNNPSLSLRQFCAYISDGDYQSAFAMTGSTVDVSSGDLEDSAEGMLLQKIAGSIRIHAIAPAEVKVFTARQTLSVTHIDLRLVVRKTLAEMMKETSEYEWKHGSYKTDEEIAAAVNDILLSSLEGDMSDCMITEMIHLNYRYTEGRWMPVMDGALYDALTGCAREAVGSVTGFFDEYRSAQSGRRSE